MSELIVTWHCELGSLFDSIHFHRQIIFKAFRAPINFYEITPTKPIISPFSKDIDVIDKYLGLFIEQFG